MRIINESHLLSMKHFWDNLLIGGKQVLIVVELAISIFDLKDFDLY